MPRIPGAALTPLFTLLLACVGAPERPDPVESDAPTGETTAPEPAVELGMTIHTVAGVAGQAGLGADGGKAVNAALYLPQDGAYGADGVWWIADYNNHRIREVDAGGTIRTILGSGFPGDGPPGPALAARFDHPTMVEPDPADPNILWIAATGNHRIVKLNRGAGTVSWYAGTGLAGWSGDGGLATFATFERPSSVAFAGGAMYVSDKVNQVIRRIGPDGVVSTIAGTPGVRGYSGDGGPASDALLSSPVGQETDPGNRITANADAIWIADTGNGAVRRIDLATGIITTVATGLLEPHDVAVAPDGAVYVADTGSHCVRRIAPDGELTTVAGVCGTAGFAGDGGAAGEALLDWPAGVAVGPDGRVLVADTHNHVIRELRPE